MTRRALAGLACVLALSPSALAQQPARDQRPQTSATAAITGHVYAADGKTPLRRAIVRISSSDLPKALATRTDERGRYEFRDLPAHAIFTLTAVKTQYLQLEYGQRRAFEPGRQVTLAGQSLANVDFQLPRAAAIGGRLTDVSGEPIDQMWVLAMRRTYVDGRRRLVASGMAVTNDIGQYRIAGLAPGDYFIVTRERGAAPTEFTREPSGYPVSYFPGTVDVQQAQPVRLTVGEQASGINLALAPMRTTTISGQVVGVDGRPSANARLSLLDHSTSGPGGNVGGGATADADGQFRIAGIRAGMYYLTATHERNRGGMEIEAAGADMPGLTLVVGSGATISARIVSSSGASLPFAPSRLELTAAFAGDPHLASGSARPAVKADWTVVWPGVNGQRVIRATRVPDGWWMKAVVRGDRDVTDDPIEVTHGQTIDDVTIVLDASPTRVAGVVRDDKGTSVSDYTVLIFSADPRRWQPESRFIRALRPDHAGAFATPGLPPGNYLAIAVDDVETGQWFDPEYLESLRQRARRIALEPGQKIDLQLTLAGGT